MNAVDIANMLNGLFFNVGVVGVVGVRVGNVNDVHAGFIERGVKSGV